jgi:hypothetical protein
MQLFEVKRLVVHEALPLLDHPRWTGGMFAEIHSPGSPTGTALIPVTEDVYEVIRDRFESGRAVSITIGVSIEEPLPPAFPPKGGRLVGTATAGV